MGNGLKKRTINNFGLRKPTIIHKVHYGSKYNKMFPKNIQNINYLINCIKKMKI